MKNFTMITCLLILLFPIFSFAQEYSTLVRYPSVNSDGSKIAFSYQGDLWVVASSGGRAERLTIHEAYDGWPQWSPDDKTIAFSSSRFGNNDLFTIPVNGGVPTRITFHSADDILNDYAVDNSLVFPAS